MNPELSIEEVGGQLYIDNGIWPLRALPFVFGKLSNSSGIEIAYALCWGGGSGVNGYARVPLEGHPWVAQYDDYEDLPVDIHGGITYGPQPRREYKSLGLPLPDQPARTWAELGGWIGFDTGHGWDVWTDEEIERIESLFPETRTPAQIERNRRMQEISREFPMPSSPFDRVWTFEQVEAEAIGLAAQVGNAMQDSFGGS